MAKALLSTTYFGPVQWYQKLNRYSLCVIEKYEHFQKQTYRNRCVIATANGPQTLSVPILQSDSPKNETLITDIRISDHGNWRHIHWNALCSAYGESPFFDYYADDLRPFFNPDWEHLFDFNLAITGKICELLDIHTTIAFSNTYQSSPSSSDSLPVSDFRTVICPKHPLTDPDFHPKPYWQVYQQRHGFLPNMSILDLLFTQGPESILYL